MKAITQEKISNYTGNNQIVMDKEMRWRLQLNYLPHGSNFLFFITYVENATALGERVYLNYQT